MANWLLWRHFHDHRELFPICGRDHCDVWARCALPGRASPPAYVVIGHLTTFLRRRWSNDDIQIAARRRFGLVTACPRCTTAVIMAAALPIAIVIMGMWLF
jgi:hypothetical protein